MKTGSRIAGRKAASVATAFFALCVAGYAVVQGSEGVSAQQRPTGGETSGTQQTQKPTGGTAAGAAEGAQAVSADPTHGRQPAPRSGYVAYPERPKAPQAVIDHGKAAFSVNCAFCHGSDAGGGSVGPNLLRSEVVLQDKDGELILPIVHGARSAQGMPKIDIPDSTVPEIAAWLHSLKTGGNIRSTEKINIVVGNAASGKQAFGRICASCHSVDGDLKGFAAKYSDPRAMQQAWLLPSGGGRNPANMVALDLKPVTATVTEANGTKTSGKLDTLDDFYVEITSSDGTLHRYTRVNDAPRVDVHDPMEAHRALFRTYSDKDIHDITAYLESLK